jgi:hypothetical protein
MRNVTTLALSLLMVTTATFAEEPAKPLSPPAKAEATFRGKKVTIDYSAPSKRDRRIMGGLVPFGQVWRTGANAATTLTTEADLMIGTVHVPAGTYTLYTVPAQKKWTLIINKQTGQSGTKYDQAQDLGRTKMSVTWPKTTAETFTIALKAQNARKGTLTLTWENTQASVPIMVH